MNKFEDVARDELASDATEQKLEADLAATGYVEPKLAEQMTAEELVARVHALEAALMPFAIIAVGMGHAKMNLPVGEPSGGHWLNTGRSTALTPSEIYFFQALTVRGRKAVEARLIADIKTAEALTMASKEQAETALSGGRVDH